MTQKIFFIAGEPSGDALGGSLIAALKKEYGDNIEISGIGGLSMGEQGLKSLIPMEEIAVMGIAEVLGHLPRLLRLINGVVEEVEKFDPDVVITIDLPDFNFQVGSRLKKRGKTQAKVIHYVAPTVWAWRAGRAKKVSGFLDGMMCLFPFEPTYFQKHNLPTKYVGHPLIEKNLETLEKAEARKHFEINDDELVIGTFLGSREEEVKKMSPVISESLEALLGEHPNLVCILPTLPNLEFLVRDLTQSWAVKPLIVVDPAHKYKAFKSCDFGIAVSGTVGLELAYLNVPHVIIYKTSWLTYAIAKLLVKTKFIHLQNIILNQPVTPEYVQLKCNSETIFSGLLNLMKKKEEQEFQKQASDLLRKTLRGSGTNVPSESAVAFIKSILENTYKPEENIVFEVPILKRPKAEPESKALKESSPSFDENEEPNEEGKEAKEKQDSQTNLLSKIWEMLRKL